MSRKPFQFSILSLLVLVAVCAALLSLATHLLQPVWRYEGQLHRAIERADRIVVRDGGYDWDSSVDTYPVLFEITSAAGVKDVFDHLEFQVGQSGAACSCQGYPVIDWYSGEERLARTSLQHGRAIRWSGFVGDAELTPESGAWLVNWVFRHGAPRGKMSL